MSIENLLIDLTAAIRELTATITGGQAPATSPNVEGSEGPKASSGRGRPRKTTEQPAQVNNSPATPSLFDQNTPEPSTTATPPVSEAVQQPPAGAPSAEAASTATTGQAGAAAPSAPPATQTPPTPTVSMEEFSKVFLELYEANANGVNGMQVVTAILGREGVKRAKELAADRMAVVYDEMKAHLATAKGNGAASLL